MMQSLEDGVLCLASSWKGHFEGNIVDETLRGSSHEKHLLPIHSIGDKFLVTGDPMLKLPSTMRLGGWSQSVAGHAHCCTIHLYGTDLVLGYLHQSYHISYGKAVSSVHGK